MVRIGTPINKPTPRSIVTSLASSLFLAPSLLPISIFRSSFLFLPLPFLFLFRCSSARRRFSSLFFRPLFYHVQGKPINHRIPPVYCGTPGCRLEPATSPTFLYSASRPFAWADVRTFANYRPVVTCTLTSCESGAKGKSNRKRKVKRYITKRPLSSVTLPCESGVCGINRDDIVRKVCARYKSTVSIISFTYSQQNDSANVKVSCDIEVWRSAFVCNSVSCAFFGWMNTISFTF